MPARMSYDEAKERVKELRDFYWHLAVFVIINLFLFAINRMTSPGYMWCYWVLICWGVGVAFHGASVLIEDGPWGKNWERRKIRELMGEDEPGEEPRDD